MAKTYPVKWMSSSFRGAPQIDGSAGGGGYLAALYAFLITGFGESTALSVSVTDGVGTAVFPAGISFEYYSVVLFAGVTSPAQLNGEARILSVSGSTVTFETDAPNGVATGTITCRYAPVGGWDRPFYGTGKAVFKSIDPQSPGFCLRVDDTGSNSARIRGYESMTDLDTGVNPFPTDAQISGGGYQIKSTVTTTAAIIYSLMADSRMLLTAISAGRPSAATAISAPVRGFGDLIPLNPAGDPFCAAISCGAGGTVGTASFFSNGTFALASSGADSIYAAREMGGSAGAKALTSFPFCGSNSLSGGDNTLGTFPSDVDGELKYSRRYVPASDGKTPRAIIPGVLHIPQSTVYGKIAHGDFVSGSGPFVNRKLMALATGTNSPPNVPTGVTLIDVTGPWR
ncbi:hypothetical protein [Diaphorobacter caeni]|uniref:hypothetical protein n=1 Tax=Diaphorobacter caeni TaxID=2784387 RepID=UPI00188F9D6C|nr:hypothetical protein [Diaphorobacter caeni]MBF5006355.1 hypothetical protein [Diaphorobacter caeni]